MRCGIRASGRQRARATNIANPFLIAPVLFIVAAFYLIPVINAPLNVFDEGTILVGAERVLKGQVPNRDFFTVYPPGQFFTLAGLFELFGTSVTVERIYDVAIRALLCVAVFVLTRSLSSNGMALLGWALSLVWLGRTTAFPAYPVYPAMLFIYLAISCALLHIDRSGIRWVAWSAVLIVLAGLFRHDLGGPAGAIIGFVLLLRRGTGRETSWAPLMCYVGTVIGAALPVIAYFHLNSAGQLAIDDLILWPMNEFPRFQELPYPIRRLPFFVFPAVLVVGVLRSLILLPRTDDESGHGLLLVSLIGASFMNQARVRSDMIHLFPVALTALVVAPILLHGFSTALPRGSWRSRMTRVLVIVIFVGVSYGPVRQAIRSFPEQFVVRTVNPDHERIRYLKVDPDLMQTVEYVRDHTADDEYIFVGVKNHDRLIFNSTVVYFLAARDCPTRYHEFNPGLTNTRAVQQEMLRELKSKPVQLAILAPGWVEEPNLSRLDAGVELLDRYIRENFRLVRTYGIYEIWAAR